MDGTNASELGRQLAAQRRPKTVTCPICGMQVTSIGRRTYCNKRCANVAWWRRHRGKAAQAPGDGTVA